MKEIAQVLVPIINTGDLEKASPVFDFIVYMFDQADSKRPETKPHEPLLARKECFQGLFKFTKTIELRAFKIIERLLQTEPLKVVAYVQDHPRELRPLCELVASKESNEAGHLLHALAVANLDVIMPKLHGFIAPHFKLYPVATAIDLMLATETSQYSMRRLIPRDQLPAWLLSHASFSVSDVEIVTRWDKDLWVEQDVAIQMFMKSGPPAKFKDIAWMHDRPPPRVKVDQTVATICMTQIVQADKSPETFEKSPEGNSTRDPYLFIRFFVLSLADPKIITPQTMGILTKSISDDCECVSAAAMQTFGYWAIRSGFEVSSEVIFRTAARAVKGRMEFTGMAKCMLHVYGRNSDLAATILQNDLDVRFDRSMVVKVRRDSMVFAHFGELIATVPTFEIYDDLQANLVIGCMLDYFEPEEEEEEM